MFICLYYVWMCMFGYGGIWTIDGYKKTNKLLSFPSEGESFSFVDNNENNENNKMWKEDSKKERRNWMTKKNCNF